MAYNNPDAGTTISINATGPMVRGRGASPVTDGAWGPRYGNPVKVSKIKIYESNRRPRLEKDGITTARDFHYGKKTRSQIEEILPQAFDLFSPGWQTVEEYGEYQLELFSSLAQGIFARGEMNAVIKEMIYHMRDGNGADYENETLTNRVLNHTNTETFIASAKSVFRRFITMAEGDVNRLAWKEGDLSKRLYDSFYNGVDSLKFTNDTFGGLRIAINDVWGYEIWLENYDYNGASYTSKLYFDIYDHFGLDDDDIKFGRRWGPFVPWFTLQHWNEYQGKYKPFVTRVPLRVDFPGFSLTLKA